MALNGIIYRGRPLLDHKRPLPGHDSSGLELCHFERGIACIRHSKCILACRTIRGLKYAPHMPNNQCVRSNIHSVLMFLAVWYWIVFLVRPVVVGSIFVWVRALDGVDLERFGNGRSHGHGLGFQLPLSYLRNKKTNILLLLCQCHR